MTENEDAVFHKVLANLKEKERAERWAAFIGLIVLVVAGIWLGVPQMVDSTGYVSHTVRSVITAQGDWIVGESKACTTIPLGKSAASAAGRQPGYALSYVKCDDGPEHTIDITFWGAEVQPKSWMTYWNCERRSDSFVCRQTGADSLPR